MNKKYPENYLRAIGVDPTRDSLNGVEKYLNSGLTIKALFLDYYKNNMSLEQLSEKYPVIMKQVTKGGVSIDTIARKNYVKDDDIAKLYVYGYGYAESMFTLQKQADEIARLKQDVSWRDEQIQLLEEKNNESKRRVEMLENDLRVARAERDMRIPNGYHITQDILDMQIEDMDMERRGKSIFKRKLQLRTVGEALDYIRGDFDRLLSVPTAGETTVKNIKEAFERLLRKGA